MRIKLLKINKKATIKKINFLVCLLVVFGLFFSPLLPLAPYAYAAFNPAKEINYQGKLTLASGVAVTNASYSIVFSLYTVASGGSAVWTETRSVTTTSGLFSEMLGSGTSLTSAIFNQTLYLGVKVGTDAEMTPRKKLGVVPAAFISEKSQNLIGGNSTTELGSIPYQSDTDTTSLVVPNITTTKKFLNMTGTGTNGAVPGWDALVDADIPDVLTGTTYNGLTFTAATTGFTIAGGTTSKTLTVSDDATVSGTNTGGNTGDQSITSLGGTTVGSNFFTLTNPSAITFPRINVDNTVSALDAANFRTAIGAGTGGGTVTSVAALTLGTTGTDLSSTVADGTTTPVITLNVPTASASNRGVLSSTDWSTFNGKAAALSGTVNYVSKFTGTGTTIGNSSIFDNGNVGIGTTTPGATLDVHGSTSNSTAFSFQAANLAGTALLAVRNDGNVGIGTTGPNGKLDIRDGETHISYTGLSQPFTAVAPATSAGRIYSLAGTSGGLGVMGLSSGDKIGLVLYGEIGTASPTASTPAIRLQAGKQNGTGIQNLAATETVLAIYNGNSFLASVLGNGNVGIGTTTPDSLLHIKSVSSYANINIQGGQAGDAGWLLMSGYPNAGDFTIRESSVANYLTIKKTTGNVGIGTTAPNAKLDVTLSGNPTIQLTDSSLTGTLSGDAGKVFGTLSFNWGASTYAYMPHILARVNSINPDYSRIAGLEFHVANVTDVTAMSILGNGNVGIGTTNPQSLLHVSGTTNGEVGARIENYNSGSSAFSILRLKNDTANQLALFLNSSTRSVDGGVNGATLRNDAGALSLQSTGNNGIYIAATTGNVGIGTTNPTANLTISKATSGGRVGLDIYNTSDTAGNYASLNLNAQYSGGAGSVTGTIKVDDTLLMTIANDSGNIALMTNGNVGIGTTDPAGYTLHIKNATPTIRLSSAAETAGLVQELYFGTPTYNRSKIKSTNVDTGAADLSLWTTPSGGSALERVTILSTGNVGIGTSLPTSKLSIAGDINSNNGDYVIMSNSFQGGTLGQFVNNGAIISSAGTDGTYVESTTTATWNHGIYSKNTYERKQGLTLYSDWRKDIDGYAMFGWHNASEDSYFVSGPHIVYFVSGGPIRIYENGADVYVSPLTWTLGVKYRVKITLKDAGAIYYLQDSTTNQWHKIYESSTVTTSPLRVSLDVYSGKNTIGKLAVVMGDNDPWSINGQSTNGTFASFGAGNNYFAGNLGIGTTNPGASLHVAAENSNYDGTIKIGARAWLQHRDAGSTTTSLINDYNDNAARIDFRMKGTAVGNAVMTILGSGNVGIGTTGPTLAKLQVIGNIYSNSNIKAVGSIESNTSLDSYELRLSGTYKVNWGNPGWATDAGSYSLNNAVAPDGTTTATLMTMSGTTWDLYNQIPSMTEGHVYRVSTWVKLGTATNFVFAPNNGAWNTLVGRSFTSADGLNTSTWTKVTHEFTYVSGGRTYVNFHIGGNGNSYGPTQTPGTLWTWGWEVMEVDDSAYNIPAIKLDGKGTNPSYFNAGNVGIGTTGPNGKLQIWDSAGSGIKTYTASATNQGLVLHSQDTQIEGIQHPRYSDIVALGNKDGTNGGGTIRFLTNPADSYDASERMRIDRNGNVGIGTTAPRGQLSISSQISGSLVTYPSSAGTSQNILNGYYVASPRYTRYFDIAAVGDPTDGVNSDSVIRFLTNTVTSGASAVEQMRINGTGNVGIGTTGPASMLTIKDGDLRLNKTHLIGNTGTWKQNILFTDEVDRIGAKIVGQRSAWSGAPMDLSFETGGVGTTSEVMRITSGGNVGIGTTGPTNLLTLRGTDAGNIISELALENFITTNPASGNGVAINFNLNNSSNPVATLGKISLVNTYYRGNTDMIFSVAGGNTLYEAMRIVGGNPVGGGTINGNVGIGTTGPGAKLDIKSSAVAVGTDDLFKVGLDANWYLKLQQNWNTGGLDYNFIQQAGTSASNNFNVLSLSHGNVGIGTTGPYGKLTVSGASSAEPSLTISSVSTAVFGGGGGNELAITNSGTSPYTISLQTRNDPSGGSGVSYPLSLNPLGGNVGIGTTGPSSLLHLQASSGVTQMRLGADTSAGFLYSASANGMELSYGRSGVDGVFPNTGIASALIGLNGFSANSYITFRTSATNNTNPAEVMRIDKSGNVGIGTTRDLAWLYGKQLAINGEASSVLSLSASDVVTAMFYSNAGESFIGTTTDAPFYIKTNDTYKVSILSNGNVGIGTITPSEKLSVVGNGLFTGSMSSKGISSPSIASFGFNSASYLYGITNSPSWNIGVGSYTNNNVVAPDGTTTASTLNLNLLSTNWDLYQNFSVTSGVSYKIGVWIKLGSATNFCMTVNNGSAWNTVGAKCFNSADGLSTTGWTYVSYIFTGPATNIANLHIGASFDTGVAQTAGTVYAWNWEVTKQNGGTSPVSTFAGYVGIGTMAPGGQLSLNNQISAGVNTINYTATEGVNGQSIFNSYYTSTSDGVGPYPRYLDIASVGQPDGTNGGSNIRFLTNPITLNSPAVERMRISSNGNVGIGTTAPGTALDVQMTNATTNAVSDVLTLTHLTSGTAADGIGTGILFNAEGSAGGTINLSRIAGIAEDATATQYSGALGFYTYLNNGAFTEQVRITGSGNVGIGTTAPTQTLSVIQQNTPTDFSSPIFILGGNGTDSYATGATHSIGFSYDPSVLPQVSIGYTPTDTGGNVKGDLLFATRNVTTNTAPSERMRITAAGNVGIGTTAPGKKLHVAGSVALNATSTESLLRLERPYNAGTSWAQGVDLAVGRGITYPSTQLRFMLDNGSNNSANPQAMIMALDSAGNVGIGTTGPAEKLSVYGGAISVDRNGTSKTIMGYVDQTGLGTPTGMEAADWLMTGGLNNDFIIGTQGNDTGEGFLVGKLVGATLTPQFLVDSLSGNVGIGTTVPGSKLSINGGLHVGGDSNAGDNNLLVDGTIDSTTLNTGQGANELYDMNQNVQTTDSPTFAGLTVNGDISLTGGSRTVGIPDTSSIADAYDLAINAGNNSTSYQSFLYGGILTLLGGNAFNQYGDSLGGNIQIFAGDALDNGGNNATGGDVFISGGYTSGTDSGDRKGNVILGYSAGAGAVGNVGIGLIDPTYKLQVNGQPAANGYTAFTNYSDRRLKENITNIVEDGSDILGKISQLRPVSFNYNELSGYDAETRARRVSGFIAQELQQVFPEMVGGVKINGVDYLDTNLSNLPLYLVEAVQELNTKLNTQSDLEIALTGEIDTLKENISGIALIDEEQSVKIESMNLKLGALTGEIIPVAGSDEETFMNNFFANLYVKVGDWLASADNGIKTIFARKISTRLLCIADEAGVETCVEKTQLDNLLAKAGEVSAGEINDVGGVSTDTPAVTEINPNAPVITLVGDATVNLDINGVYNELGANVVDDVDTFVAVSITGVPDNSTDGIYAIHYTAVDSEGNNAIELIRKVIVGTGDYTLTGVSADSWASGDTASGVDPVVTTDTTTVTDTTSATTVPAGFDEGAVTSGTTTTETTTGTTDTTTDSSTATTTTTTDTTTTP